MSSLSKLIRQVGVIGLTAKTTSQFLCHTLDFRTELNQHVGRDVADRQSKVLSNPPNRSGQGVHEWPHHFLRPVPRVAAFRKLSSDFVVLVPSGQPFLQNVGRVLVGIDQMEAFVGQLPSRPQFILGL